MTANQRTEYARAAQRALDRAADARERGDRAGAAIAETDARRLMRQLDADRMTASSAR